MLPTTLPANLVFLRPRNGSAHTSSGLLHGPRTVRGNVISRRELFERLDTLGALAPSAPLSFLIVQVRGLETATGNRGDADRTMEAVGKRVRELTRATDLVGWFTPSSVGIVLQGTGAMAASASASRLTHHLNQLVAGLTPALDVAVYVATGTGANADMLPVAALDSLDDCG